MRKLNALTLFAASFIVGGSSLLAFGLFLYAGDVLPFPGPMSTAQALVLDAALCLLFIIPHSLLVRRSTREKLSRLVPDLCYGAFYSLVSGACLFLLVLFWHQTGSPIFNAAPPWRWLFRGCFFATGLGFLWTYRALDTFDPLGNQCLLNVSKEHTDPAPPKFSIRGPFRYIRHPFYLFTIVLFWCHPAPTPDRLLCNAIFTLWIILGIRWEERDLRAHFGPAYDEYKRNVPMLVPFLCLSSSPDSTGQPPDKT